MLLGPANNVFNANFTLHRTDKDTTPIPLMGGGGSMTKIRPTLSLD